MSRTALPQRGSADPLFGSAQQADPKPMLLLWEFAAASCCPGRRGFGAKMLGNTLENRLSVKGREEAVWEHFQTLFWGG